MGTDPLPSLGLELGMHVINQLLLKHDNGILSMHVYSYSQLWIQVTHNVLLYTFFICIYVYNEVCICFAPTLVFCWVSHTVFYPPLYILVLAVVKL